MLYAVCMPTVFVWATAQQKLDAQATAVSRTPKPLWFASARDDQCSADWIGLAIMLYDTRRVVGCMKRFMVPHRSASMRDCPCTFKSPRQPQQQL